jgi:hypothetical protein
MADFTQEARKGAFDRSRASTHLEDDWLLKAGAEIPFRNGQRHVGLEVLPSCENGCHGCRIVEWLTFELAAAITRRLHHRLHSTIPEKEMRSFCL